MEWTTLALVARMRWSANRVILFLGITRHAIVLALLSAALFGASTPTAKSLLGAIDPTVLAGLPYCGTGFGVAVSRRVLRSRLVSNGTGEASLARKDLPWLTGAIVAGGIVGPALLMLGLARTDASTASF